MRRWLTILLLVLLPAQFSWAAVAAYCGHESGTQARHFGHHAHQHADAEPLPDPAGKTVGASALDLDCSHCHSSCCSLGSPVGALSPLALASKPARPAAHVLRTLAQSPPERPQWLRFA